MKIDPNSYTAKKMRHTEHYNKMIDDGWIIITEPRTWNPGPKYKPITSQFRFWHRINPETKEPEKMPFIGFI